MNNMFIEILSEGGLKYGIIIHVYNPIHYL